MEPPVIDMLNGKFWVIFILTPMIFFGGCNVSSVLSLEGTLIFTGGGNKIEVISFGGKVEELSNVYKKSKVLSIGHITKISDIALLFDECSGERHCTIYQLNIDSKESQRVRTGIFPQYIPGHDKVLFYDKSDDDRNWLFMATLSDVNEVTRIAEAPKRKIFPNGIPLSRTLPVVQISQDEVVFLSGDGRLTRFNLQNSQLSSLGVDDCRPLFWRTSTQQLFCTNENAKEPFFFDPHTQQKEAVPVFNRGYGFVYIEGLDSVLYGRTRPLFPLGEAPDLFFYSFSEKKEVRVKTYSHIVSGIWLPQKK